MPVIPQAMSTSIFLNEKGVAFSGKNNKDIADAISMALCTYVTTTPNLISFFLSGVAGPVGNLNSIVVSGIVPQAMSSLMVSRALSKGLRGKSLKHLFDAVSNGVSLSLNGMFVSGLTAGLAMGNGVGRFTFIQDLAVANYLRASFASKLFRGKNVRDIIDCIAFGFSMHMRSSPIVSATVLGAIAPIPPVGPVPMVAMPTVFNAIT